MTISLHEKYMTIAIRMATSNLGKTAPNPSVGCVIVKENKIIAISATNHGGRPHAEVIAINNSSKADLLDATMYVTLEPCSHIGKTPPCTEKIIASGISQVVIATMDFNKIVNGNGIKQLKKAGIKVITGICEQEAIEVNKGFFYNMGHFTEMPRPYITIKIASTFDGKIATKTKESQWITNQMARNYGHKLRSNHDAIAVGSGTIISDNPSLNCRLSGLEQFSPKIVIFDNSARIDNSYKLFQLSKETNKEIIVIANKNNFPNEENIKYISSTQTLPKILTELAQYGITRLLVEGGPTLIGQFITHNLVDQIHWLQAPIVIGSDGLDAINSLNITKLIDASKFKIIKNQILDG
ncbi:MAG: bifunctional diaminohydroxyphosphoribosylaminopyrimidine deaminase/5-amino-6-(5-phosphoribosylamino)uracil reductase RibD, partial [Pseudomonadota bacterium]